MDIKPYERRVNYYETDQMGIVHHSNYIRYFEEARIVFMHDIGCDVQELENIGLIIPNVDAYAKYLKSVKFFETINIKVKLVEFNGVKMKFEYTVFMENSDEVVATGFTTHCFVNSDFKPLSVKRSHPDIFIKMKNAMEE